MKYTRILLIGFFSLWFSLLQAEEKEISSRIDRVSVFYQGAQIERTTGSVTLPAGQSELVIRGLESHLQQNSLRVGIMGKGTILTVVTTIDYLNEKSSSKQIEELKVRLEKIGEQIEDETMQQKVYEQERTLLLNNSTLGGTQTGVTVAQIREAAAYYRVRLTEIEQLVLDKKRSIKKLEEERTRINRQLSELNYQKTRPTSTLNVTVEMESTGTCALQFDYYISNASWYPQYDLRIDKIGDPVSLIRKAVVRQSTGEDWGDVILTFSTGNPNERQVLPELRPWYLDFIQPQAYNIQKNRGAVAKKSAQPAMAQQVQLSEAAVADAEYDYSPPPVTQSSKHSILEFTLNTKGSVPSDNNEYNFSLGTEELKAEYHYQAVPKLEKSAYLVATISDWEGYELVDGVANIYYEKTFIGETFLGTTMLLDSLQLSLGKDKGLVVDRKSVKDFTRTRSIGSNVKKTFAYEIQVRNTKPVVVDLILEDQLPVSANSQISVDMEEKGDGILEEASGKVTWRISLDPNETMKIPLRYSVKYPKGMFVGL